MEEKKEELKTEVHESGAEQKRGRSRKHAGAAKGTEGKKFPAAGVAAAVIILTAGASSGYYFAQAGTYNEAFLPNTTINGIDVSKMTVDEVKAAIEAGLSSYELTVLERTGASEVIKTEEIGLHSEFDGSLDDILNAQEPMKWITALWTPSEHEIEAMIVYDENMLLERIRSLSCMDEETIIEPQNAYLSDYRSETKSYEIVPAVEGTELVEEHVLEAVGKAVIGLQSEVDLDAEMCYAKPSVYEDDASLISLAAELNTYVGAVVNHTFGDAKEVLDGDTINEWLTISDSVVTLDESGATQYVRALAKKYNTAYSAKKLKTSYGTTVTVPAGPYGWRMNETKEAAAVLEAVKAGSQVTREPEWLQTAASHGDYDYGDTYVEVNLTGQHLFFYKDGKLIVETDFVSGNASKGWSTPAGAYPLTYKQRNATLRGENYETPVSYWMPFNGNIGLHDADWRSSFGGTLYKTGGSHGCVNLPPKAAKLIYENISAGDPVLCYHLDGTETKTTSKASDINTSGIVSAQGTAAVTGTTAAETTAATTAPTTAAPETTPAAPETVAPPVEETTAGSVIQPETPVTAPTEPIVQEATTAATIVPETPAVSPTPETTAAAPVQSGDISAGPGAVSPTPESTGIGPGYSSGGPGSTASSTENSPAGPGGPGA